ncbi:Multiple PDZ domain protein [Armadillidium nasatum]|uniref:Multiple PDZ domain protein n=1 Tax=Armadillidium nasatum TaxID=96803 RepID=A0A5N5SPH7_9CRUS|nr:Multiple PDZ domain protein [Armadillidium nasatum]
MKILKHILVTFFFQGSIVIHEIYPEGAVAKDGRLRSGDQILEVNNEDFRTIVHQKALNALRQTPSKVPGGVAESDGRLMQGDQIFEVNDKNLRSASQEHAAAILKCAPASVNIKIGRLKPGKRIPHNLHPTWPVTIIEGPSRTPSSLSPEFPFPQPPLLISPHTIPQLQPPSPTSQSPPSPPIAIAQTVPPFRTVVLERGDDGLGFSIVGGFGSNLGDLPVYVKCIFDRGAAAREGSLRRGDQILQVNGRPLAGLTHVQAVGILKEAKGTVTLTIVPSK